MRLMQESSKFIYVKVHCLAQSKCHRVSALITVVIYSIDLGFHVFVGCKGLSSRASVSSCCVNMSLMIRCLTDETGKTQNTVLHVSGFPCTLREQCVSLQVATKR